MPEKDCKELINIWKEHAPEHDFTYSAQNQHIYDRIALQLPWEHNFKSNLMCRMSNSGKDCMLSKVNCKVLKSNFVKRVGKLMKSNSCEVSLLFHGRYTIDLASYRITHVNRLKIHIGS